jgi:NAD+ synthase (glutamine-hydrolysing)
VKHYLARAREHEANIILFPELTLAGYPPEDLLLKPGFASANRAGLEELLPHSRDLTAIVGFVHRQDDLFNAAAVLHHGQLAGIYHKALLPNYAVFDEDRYFGSGETPWLFGLTTPSTAYSYPPAAAGQIYFGVSVCEDI